MRELTEKAKQDYLDECEPVEISYEDYCDYINYIKGEFFWPSDIAEIERNIAENNY